MELNKQVCGLELSKRLRELKGYEGIYVISDEGTVYSIARSNGFGSRLKTREKAVKIDRGYVTVTLSKNKKLSTKTVHRLVAVHFVKGRSEKKNQVNHMDGNKLNNKASNLEWCDASHNQVHARKMGLMGGEKSNTAKLNTAKVLKIRLLYSKGGVTLRSLGDRYGVTEATIGKVIKRNTWKYV